MGAHAATRKIQIIQMAEHFLYLPIYYAKAKNFFGKIPPQYSVEVVSARPKTDEQAFRALMDVSSDKRRSVVFAVCDPTVVLTVDSGSRATPAILAGLITNAAFWAVDHRSRRVKLLRDLAEFDRMIAYHPGTTSYAIARRIFHDKQDKIYCVDPKEELSTLTESPRNSVALSPDILEIEALITGDDHYDIDLAIGSTPEYNNVLVTALLSRADVVRDDPDLVGGLLEALQLSLFAVAAGGQEFSTWAAQRFVEEDVHLVDRALNRAREAQLFPTTIDVNEAHWLNAARTVAAAIDRQYDDASAAEAKNMFETAVAPYRHLAREAVVERVLRRVIPAMGQSHKPSDVGRYFVSGLVAGLVTALVVWLTMRFTHEPLVPIAIVLTAMAALPFLYSTYRRRRLLLLGHIVFVLVELGAAFLWRFSVIDLRATIEIWAAFGGAHMGVWVTEVVKAEKAQT